MICPDDEEDLHNKNNIPRIDRDFGGENVFVQTNDYNVFINSNGLNFHSLEPNMVETIYGKKYEWEDEESEEILEKLVLLFEVEDPLREFHWY